MKLGETTVIRVSASRRLGEARYVGPLEAFGDVGSEMMKWRHRVFTDRRTLRQLQAATEEGFYTAMIRAAVAIVSPELFRGFAFLMIAILMLMVTEMMGSVPHLMLAIDTCPGPAKLEWDNDKKKNYE